MASPNQEAIDTFISITGASEAVAFQKLEEHGGDLNEAVNAYFSVGDRNMVHPTPTPAPQDDLMVIDDDPFQMEPQRPPLSAASNLNPFSLLDPNFRRSFFEGRGPSEFSGSAPFVSHPRDVREIPIEFKDGNDQSSHSGSRPIIEEITGTASVHGPEVHGNVIIDDDEDEDTLSAPFAHVSGQNERNASGLPDSERRPIPSAPELGTVTDYSNDIEEEMILAAIEASKREVEEGHRSGQIQNFGVPSDTSILGNQQREPHLEDDELARAVSLSLKTAEQEKALREQVKLVGTSDKVGLDSLDVEELANLTAINGRQGFDSSNKGTSSRMKFEAGSSSILDEAEDVEEQPLVRHRSRRMSSGSLESAKEAGDMEESPPSSPGPHTADNPAPHNGETFHSDEWGGISSVEHDEAVMLEAALFGGIPEGTPYSIPYAPHQLMQPGNVGLYPRPAPRPPSPTLTAQRLIREQQDDEYLASLQADREKELKAMEEAEARRLEEQAAKEAALEEERRKEEESHKKKMEEEEFERQLAVKEASLPQEPASDDDNAITLLIRMPDGSRRGRRFLKSDRIQSLFDFIDVGRVVKPGSYRLVRPFPRRAFSDGRNKQMEELESVRPCRSRQQL